ncbi:MAG: hypothetical protein HY271_17710 [Deltaproteobacteria bacterium]|nr:hypothetical protein [Deltaproteobacteria bacterium]
MHAGFRRGGRLLLSQLGVPFELVEMDIEKGETRTPDFLRRNPNGRIPVVGVMEGHLATRTFFVGGSIASLVNPTTSPSQNAISPAHERRRATRAE